jgi:metal-responsive CopG/Arc/MetJ family transcriptional regulator
MNGNQMKETITINLPKKLIERLEKFADSEKVSRNDIITEALKSYLSVAEFRRIQKQMIPKAEAIGIFSDEDVFKIVD